MPGPIKKPDHQKQDLHMGQGSAFSPTRKVDRRTFTIETVKKDNQDQYIYTPWITKLNKNLPWCVGNPLYSRMENAFAGLAFDLFIRRGFTPQSKLVRDKENKVFGIASEDISVQIKKLREERTQCYAFQPKNWEFEPITGVLIETPEDEIERRKILESRCTPEERAIPAFMDAVMNAELELKKDREGKKFLDEMPKNFFPSLLERHEAGDVEIDMESLASILAASYTLEEDDLHKGNMGFYVTDAKDENGNLVKDKNGVYKKKFTFFKIDHDMMFMDSIMSRNRQARPNNWLYGMFDKDTFKITATDLDRFPDIKDSKNHFWPARHTKTAKGYSGKEAQAFANLKNYPAFQNAKWNEFLKYSLMPNELVKNSLVMHLDSQEDKDKIAMIGNTVAARMKELTRALLGSKEFSHYLQTPAGIAGKEVIKKEIEAFMKTADMAPADQKRILEDIDSRFNSFITSTESMKTTNLTKTIELDCYDFSTNDEPTSQEIDCAIRIYTEYRNESDMENAFKYACITLDLVEKSGISGMEKQVKELKKVKNEYLKPELINTYEDFTAAANRLRTSDLPLKQQKNEILDVLKLAKLKLPHQELQKIKEQLEMREPTDQSLKFIKQLRSEVWIVRLIFKLYNRTETSSNMLTVINAQLKKPDATPQEVSKEAHAEKTSEASKEKPIEVSKEESIKASKVYKEQVQKEKGPKLADNPEPPRPT